MDDGNARGRRPRRALAVALLVATGLALQPGSPLVARAEGINLVRLDGILGTTQAPGAIVEATLAIGKKSVPFSVLSAQRISGDPFNGPGILLALGPGPPPIRVEGREGMVDKLLSSPAGTRVVVVGDLNVGSAFMTLMSVEVTPSASPSAGAQ